MATREAAADVMQHLVEHDWHGYTQGSGRWGDGEGYCDVQTCDGPKQAAQGDRDCSSAVISSLQAVGIPTGAATYTGNMHDIFLATGVWRSHAMSDGYSCDDGYIAQRGDVYLNRASHTAMCSSAVPDRMYEFYIAETGGIYGEVGDQLQQRGQLGESRESGYSGFPWDECLEYVGGAQKGSEARPIQIWPINGTDAQRWAVEWVDDVWFKLRNVACGKYLDVMGGAVVSGTPCQVYPGNGTDAQLFCLAESKSYVRPSSVAPQAVIPKVNTGLALDVKGGGNVQGTGIHVFDTNDTAAQQWYVLDNGDGTWCLLNNSQGAKLALDVVGGGA